MLESNKKVLKIEEAAEYLQLTVSRLRYEVFIKRIPHIKLGRSIRFTKDQLDNWLESNSNGGQE